MYSEEYVLEHCMHNSEDVLRDVFFPMFKDSLDEVVGVPNVSGYGTAVRCLHGMTFDEWKAKHYKEFRKKEYPDLSDQLDMMFHDLENGTTTWQEAIKCVKDKYSKFEEGCEK